MAIARKCDRCKKLYEYYPIGIKGGKIQRNAVRRCTVLSSGYLDSEDDNLDLCPKCMEEFDEFMIGGKFGND